MRGRKSFTDSITFVTREDRHMPRVIRPEPAAIVVSAETLESLTEQFNSEEKKFGRTTVDHVLKQGQRLLTMKKMCGHGKWMKWCEENIPIGVDQISCYMKFSRNFGNSRNLPDDQLWEEWQRVQGSPKYREEQEEEEEQGDINDKEESQDDTPTERVEETAGNDKKEPLAPTSNSPSHVKRVPLPISSEEESTESVEQIDPPDEDIQPQRAERSQEYVTLERWNVLNSKKRHEILEKTGNSTFNQQSNESIEWALWSWNPVTGCEHNCPYCYARDIADRFYEAKFTPSIWPNRLRAARNTIYPAEKINKSLQDGSRTGRVRAVGLKNVFVCSMADLFGRWVPKEWIEAVLKEVRENKQWNFLFLTKFPIRLSEFNFPDNAWVGTTVDCQARVKNAEKAFSKVQAGVKWLSCEPLIEPLQFEDLSMFDWVIIGGASRSTKTPEWEPPSEWVVDLDKSAREAGCQVYHKSNLGRIQQYPGIPDDRQSPEPFHYLAKVEK